MYWCIDCIEAAVYRGHGNDSRKRELSYTACGRSCTYPHGIKNIIEKDDKFCIVGEVNNGKELIGFLKTSEVEIIILDISMPGSGGMEAIGVVKRAYPLVKILMLTMHKNKEYFYKAMSAGADGYLMKNDSDEELLVALEKILSGKNYISPYMTDDIAEDVILMYRNEKKSPFQVSVLLK